jgi:hypothetical protein
VQMAQRCPGAAAGEVVALPGWRFAINRRGVATLLRDEATIAYGLIWYLTEVCERALDRYEGGRQGHLPQEDGRDGRRAGAGLSRGRGAAGAAGPVIWTASWPLPRGWGCRRPAARTSPPGADW